MEARSERSNAMRLILSTVVTVLDEVGATAADAEAACAMILAAAVADEAVTVDDIRSLLTEAISACTALSEKLPAPPLVGATCDFGRAHRAFMRFDEEFRKVSSSVGAVVMAMVMMIAGLITGGRPPGDRSVDRIMDMVEAAVRDFRSSRHQLN
jgi:hypothetical protein